MPVQTQVNDNDTVIIRTDTLKEIEVKGKKELPVVDAIKFTKSESINIMRDGAYGVGITIPYQPHIELMQFTGLYDKNGKEIYESDIVEVTRQCIWEKGIVVFIDGCFFIKVSETLLALYECEPNNYELKAIGNIYENPDLLKGADNIE